MKAKNTLPSISRLALLALIAVLIVLIVSGCAASKTTHNKKGNELFNNSSFDDALAEYRLAQVDKPDAPEPYYNAANACNRMNQTEDVQTQTEQALRTAEPDLASNAWYNLGNAFFDTEQWPQSIEAYQKALRLQPNDMDAKINLELALQKLQEQQQEQQSQESQQENADQNGQNDQGEQSEQNEQEEQEQSAESEQVSSGEQETEESPATQGDEESGEMTEEQAVQLLQALLGDSQTLQEKLQEIYQAPGPSSGQDW